MPDAKRIADLWMPWLIRDDPGITFLRYDSAGGVTRIGLNDRHLVELKTEQPGHRAVTITIRKIEMQRDEHLIIQVDGEQGAEAAYREVLPLIRWWARRLTIYRLRTGKRYRVLRSFQDYYRNPFPEGQLYTFRTRHFLPYEGGYTLEFNEGNVYLQEGQAEIENFDAYWDAVE